MKKKFPIGISDFKEIIENNYFYFDKSLFIKDIIDCPSSVMLLPRPRRFGKTINMTMAKYYFEKPTPKEPELVSNIHLFENLDISKLDNKYKSHQGKYPVIFFTLKNVKRLNWKTTYQKFVKLLRDEYARHDYILGAEILNAEEKEFYQRILDLAASENDYEICLRNLVDYLHRYYNEKVMLLIDEYDRPVFVNYPSAFYDKIVGFMKNTFTHAMKDNPALEKAVVSGILQLSKVHVLEDLSVYTMHNNENVDRFGCTLDEVKKILKYYEIEDKLESVKLWYSYIFGDNTIYNPWSIVNFLDASEFEFKPYWINTSIKVLLKELIIKSSPKLKADLADIFNDIAITKPISEAINFPDLEKNDDVVWSFILHNGYLVATNKTLTDNVLYYDLAIPNREIRSIFELIVLKWIHESIGSHRWDSLVASLINNDMTEFETIFEEFTLSVSSYYTSEMASENIFEAFVLGLFVSLEEKYTLKQEKLNDEKRDAIILIPKEEGLSGLCFGFKKQCPADTIENCAERIYNLLVDKHFDEVYLKNFKGNIRNIAITINGSKCKIKHS